MNTFFKTLNVGILTIIIFFSLTSCDDSENKEINQNIETAELIQRGDAIQLGKEWDEVQNNFSKFTKAIAADPHDNQSYLREIHGDVKGSIDAMTLAVKAGYPGYEETAWAMLTLGDIYKQYGQLDNAMQVYQEILQMRPDYPFAVGAIGDVQILQGKEKEGEATLKSAMNIIPEVGFYISLAELYKKQGRTNEMNALLNEIMVMLKEDTDSGHNMNMEYAGLYLDVYEDIDKAEEYAQLEYSKRPQNIDVNRLMARVATARENIAEAKKYLTVAKSTGSVHPEIKELENLLQMT